MSEPPNQQPPPGWVAALALLLGLAIASAFFLASGIKMHELGSATAASWAQAIFSGIAILAAVGVGAVQARITWRQLRHNERQQILLNKPRLMYERRVQREAPQIEIILRSVGLGPAIIEDVDVLLDGLPFDAPHELFWVHLISHLRLPRCQNSGGTMFGEGRILAAGTEISLFRWRIAEGEETPTNEALHAETERITIIIKYRSLHKEHGIARTDFENDENIDI